MGRRIIGEHFTLRGKPKKSFETKHEASVFTQERKLNQNPYRCTMCGKYHLATTKRTKKRTRIGG